MRTEQEKQQGRDDLEQYRADRARVENIQESRDKLSSIEYALADIRDVLRGRTKPTHPYILEKLAERDKFLIVWNKENRKLRRLETEAVFLTNGQ